MPYAQLTVVVPDELWIGTVSRAHPSVTFRVLATVSNDSLGVARVELVGPSLDAVCEKIDSAETVTDLTVFESDEERRLVQIETQTPLLLAPIKSAGVPVELPFEIADGRMELAATVPQDRLSALAQTLETFDIQYAVESVQQEVESEQMLTDKQRWLLFEAIDRGYYDSPRGSSLTELAADLDMAKSTCSEMLHRAEEQVVKAFASETIPHSVDELPASAR